MAKAHTYVNFAGNTEEAFEFYRSVFGGEFLSLVRFGELPEVAGETPEADRDKIMHIGLKIGHDSFLYGTDALESQGFKLNMGNNSYVDSELDYDEKSDYPYHEPSGGD